MAVWNVCQPVLALVEAEDADAALSVLRNALTGAGFTLYEEDSDAFEAEEGTEVTPMPTLLRVQR